MLNADLEFLYRSCPALDLRVFTDNIMSNTPTKSALQSRAPMPAFGAFGAHQAPASLLLEKSHPGLRRSTPDSEALASSDDEIEHSKTSAPNNVKTGRTVRRTSWLNDTSTFNANRKPSITGPYSPSGSHPGTPGTETSAWTNANTSNPSGWPGPNTTYANAGWPNIWSQDGRKDPPLDYKKFYPPTGKLASLSLFLCSPHRRHIVLNRIQWANSILPQPLLLTPCRPPPRPRVQDWAQDILPLHFSVERPGLLDSVPSIQVAWED